MPDRKFRIACVGEAMIELSLSGNASAPRLGFAGDTLNTAIYLRRVLPKDFEVAFVSVIGTDRLSDRMADFIASEGVSTDDLKRNTSRLPGIYAIDTDDKGERSFSYWRDQSAARLLFQGEDGAEFDVIKDYDLVYLSAITLAIIPPRIRAALFDWIADYRAHGGRFAFDSNYRPRLWPDPETARRVVEQAWRITDIALPSVDDEQALFGDKDAEQVRIRLAGYGIETGALKRGADGPADIHSGTGQPQHYPPAPEVVDTTAAGDSFNAGFLAAHLTGAAMAEALRAGHDLAAKVVGHRGAIIPRDAM